MLLVYLKRCNPLFSSKFLIGQLYSNWPGSSSRTVNFFFGKDEVLLYPNGYILSGGTVYHFCVTTENLPTSCFLANGKSTAGRE